MGQALINLPMVKVAGLISKTSKYTIHLSILNEAGNAGGKILINRRYAQSRVKLKPFLVTGAAKWQISHNDL